jgi:hypothetical protein
MHLGIVASDPTQVHLVTVTIGGRVILSHTAIVIEQEPLIFTSVHILQLYM